MTGWVISIARGILACVRESLQKANVTSDRAAIDCFGKERHRSSSDIFGDESLGTQAKAISVPTRLPFPLPGRKPAQVGGKGRDGNSGPL